MNKSCLNCAWGEFQEVIDFHLCSYSGGCRHWEKAIQEQVPYMEDIRGENFENSNRVLEQIGNRCVEWEAER
ncbi:hypothetical protein PCC6912_40200 [Chlorogloeopsis fritschii PCC 6912]|uniref:Uncharacterized protein n=1 Tax=Chlorogloeopsis fritschii PCC 6912 TaxID=211165 RepID=A0A433N6L3_CHLFR|nr:hypothetical protein [Chlorogloeopsis fritschii]RUR77061.1 hypothetical protein PCC6912_40200 [Chlorogloeopsis fritschii PCC 6912]